MWAKIDHFAWMLIAVGTTVSVFTVVDYYSSLLRLSDYLPRDYVIGLGRSVENRY